MWVACAKKTLLPCIPGNENKNIMADVTTVSFSGSSAETIKKAKAFWKCIDPPPEQKSTLAVSGINHRLKTAPQAGDGSLKHCFKTSVWN